MGLEIVVKDIQEGASAEVSRIKAEGDAKASEIINEAKEVQKKNTRGQPCQGGRGPPKSAPTGHIKCKSGSEKNYA